MEGGPRRPTPPPEARWDGARVRRTVARVVLRAALVLVAATLTGQVLNAVQVAQPRIASIDPCAEGTWANRWLRPPAARECGTEPVED